MANLTQTPIIVQFEEMKRRHPDAVILFRVGNFYETFHDDAVAVSEILGITLTRRASGKAAHIHLAGFPHHALDSYLPKLIRAGKRVAICEQLEDPKPKPKTEAKRDITELITPGRTEANTPAVPLSKALNTVRQSAAESFMQAGQQAVQLTLNFDF